jgi:hypothetical protein
VIAVTEPPAPKEAVTEPPVQRSPQQKADPTPPPWEEAPIDEAPPVDEAPPEEPQRTYSPAADANSEAAELWERVKRKIMELNPMVFFYVKDTRGTAIRDGVLSVEFPPTQESGMIGMKNARNLQVAKDAIAAIRPGTELAFRLATLRDANEKKLKELFGSSLTIK